jgi:hypothetical protein
MTSRDANIAASKAREGFKDSAEIKTAITSIEQRIVEACAKGELTCCIAVIDLSKAQLNFIASQFELKGYKVKVIDQTVEIDWGQG